MKYEDAVERAPIIEDTTTNLRVTPPGYILSWLFAGQGAEALASMGQTDEQLFQTCFDTLPGDLPQLARGQFMEGSVGHFLGALNAQPGGDPAVPVAQRHHPIPGNLWIVGDYLYDSTLNGSFQSAKTMATMFAAQVAGIDLESLKLNHRQVVEVRNAKDEFFATCERDDEGHCEAGSGSTKTVVGKAEKDHADGIEKYIAKAIGGKWLPDHEPADAEVGNNTVEVKTLLKGKKKDITVHDDALLRKVEYAQKTGKTYHTVAVDERGTYEDGQHADKFSGHRIYYKRGNGKYALSKMHKVSSIKELKQLIAAKDDDLPEAAKGRLPSTKKEIEELKKRAAKASESRKRKDKARKLRLKAEGKSAYVRQT